MVFSMVEKLSVDEAIEYLKDEDVFVKKVGKFLMNVLE